jgi:hypothetical protein
MRELFDEEQTSPAVTGCHLTFIKFHRNGVAQHKLAGDGRRHAA